MKVVVLTFQFLIKGYQNVVLKEYGVDLGFQFLIKGYLTQLLKKLG